MPPGEDQRLAREDADVEIGGDAQVIPAMSPPARQLVFT
jgi:hypothetical protein